MTKNPTPAGTLGAWLRTANPGHCPCGAPLPTRRFGPQDKVRLCRNPDCLKHYKKLHQQDRGGGSFLRDVVSVTEVPEKPRRRRVTLACGHSQVMPKSLALRRDKRRRCPTCEAEAGGSTPDTPA